MPQPKKTQQPVPSWATQEEWAEVLAGAKKMREVAEASQWASKQEAQEAGATLTEEEETWLPTLTPQWAPRDDTPWEWVTA
jgi:hypothetical protein